MNENMRVCVQGCNKFEITLHHITDYGEDCSSSVDIKYLRYLTSNYYRGDHSAPRPCDASLELDSAAELRHHESFPGKDWQLAKIFAMKTDI